MNSQNDNPPAYQAIVPSLVSLNWFERIILDMKTTFYNTTRHALALSALTIFMLLMLVPKFGAMLLDNRLLHDINIWIKPIKFYISLPIYTATLVVFARWIPEIVRQKTWFKFFTGLVIASILIDGIWVSGAAAFGIGSHFNISTPLMATAYSIAGFAALILTSGALVFGILIAKNSKTGLAKDMHFAIWFGSVTMAILTVITASYMAAQTGHLVGGNLSDAEAFPIMGWATDGGDLRVAHFFASHIIHALPLFVLFTSWMFKTISRKWVLGVAVIYTAFTFYTLWEAVSGYPFLVFML
jgi:hypothetical protein